MDDYLDSDDFLDSDDIRTPLSTVAVYLHEMFCSLVHAGFSENQALTLVARISVEHDE